MSTADLASISNDLSGAEIRSRRFKQAEISLCESVKLFKASLGYNNRATLNAELNLTVIWRERGLWAESRSRLLELAGRFKNINNQDPLNGYLLLLTAQVSALLNNFESASVMLDDVDKFFSPSYSQFGAHA
ncbi:hypothetical protein, partial [Myxococcus sp. CA018]|uniref:hypothetical protein n=1 Tax=Myxococcus sp. CA018 TaxID=2651864 RepID=UPI00196A1374